VFAFCCIEISHECKEIHLGTILEKHLVEAEHLTVTGGSCISGGSRMRLSDLGSVSSFEGSEMTLPRKRLCILHHYWYSVFHKHKNEVSAVGIAGLES
jgi:hypothetical protein